MATSMKSTESHVATCLNNAKTLDLYNDGDANVIKEVILEYFTSRNDIDSDESDKFCDDDNEERVSDSHSDDELHEDPLFDDLLPALPNENVTEQNVQFQCSCKHHSGNPCSSMFTGDEMCQIRYCYMEMSHDELDIAVLAKLSCGIHLSDTTSRSRKSEQTPRKTQRTDFFHHSNRICCDTFKHMHAIGQDRLNALIKHYKEHGVTPRVHGNKKRQPFNIPPPEQNTGQDDHDSDSSDAVLPPPPKRRRGRGKGHGKHV